MGRCLDKYKKDKELVIRLAEKFALAIECNVRVFSKQVGSGLIYDFEPEFVNGHNESQILIIDFKHGNPE